MEHRIKGLLEESGLNATILARKTGIPKSTLSYIINGDVDFAKVGVGKVFSIAEALNVSVEYLCGVSNHRGNLFYSTATEKEIGAILEKYAGLDQTYFRLDDADRERVSGYIDSLLEAPKYQKEKRKTISRDERREGLLA